MDWEARARRAEATVDKLRPQRDRLQVERDRLQEEVTLLLTVRELLGHSSPEYMEFCRRTGRNLRIVKR